MDDLFKYEVPFTELVVGPSGSGKTTNIVKTLQKSENYKDANWASGCRFEGFERIIYASPLKIDNESYHIKQLLPISKKKEIEFCPIDKLNLLFTDLENKKNKLQPWLVVFDDMQTFPDNFIAQLVDLFAHRSHHQNISVVFILQHSVLPTSRWSLSGVRANLKYLSTFGEFTPLSVFKFFYPSACQSILGEAYCNLQEKPIYIKWNSVGLLHATHLAYNGFTLKPLLDRSVMFTKFKAGSSSRKRKGKNADKHAETHITDDDSDECSRELKNLEKSFKKSKKINSGEIKEIGQDAAEKTPDAND